MNKAINFLIVLMIILNNYFIVYAKEESLNKNKSGQKQFNKIEKKKPVVPDISFGSEDSRAPEELVQVFVKNDFDEEIKVKFDTNREYPIGPHESITLGQRKPGKYTLTIYNKKGEFVDNLTRSIDYKNKFVLNKDTVSNSNKITGLTTGQKVAITAGALGAAGVGSLLINKALQESSQPQQEAVEAVQEQNQIPAAPLPQLPPLVQQAIIPEQQIIQSNAFAESGMSIKFLNTKYSQLTIIVEGIDGQSIGNNWVIPLAPLAQKPQPLVLSGEKIAINPEQKIKVILPNNFELQRFGFELDIDPTDNSYVWILK